MQLTVKSLGSIKEGTIDLSKNLIVLTGANNTGKSYLTYLIYGISQFDDISDYSTLRDENFAVFEKVDSIKNAIKHGGLMHLPTIVKENIFELSEIAARHTKANFNKIFASNSINADISIMLDTSYTDSEDLHYENFKIEQGKLLAIMPDGEIDDELFYSKPFSNYKSLEDLIPRAFHILSTFVYESEVKPKTYFFPAERTAINLFAKHITATKAEIKDEFDLDVLSGMTNEELGERLRSRVRSAPKYPYAIRSYINFVNNFKKEQEESEFAAIASDMEEALTGGKIYLNEFEQLVFTPNNSRAILELHLSSSLVKSLSYLILYLRYSAKKGDQVIIDEPELNLHPDLQLAVAKSIAQMVNAGLKVIISTHSDYLIKELNNLILLGELNKREQHQKFILDKGFTSSELLTKEQVGAYILHDGTIELINLDEDGLAVPTINDAIRRVYGLAEEIYMEMEG